MSAAGNTAGSVAAQERLNRRFVDAVMANDIKNAAAALDAGADINTGNGRAPGNMLLHSMNHPDKAMAYFLLDNGIEPNTQGFSGYTPLMRAVSMKDKGILERLLERGANPNWPPLSETGEGKQRRPSLYPLHQACINGSLEIAELLIDGGADIQACAHAGGSPLWYAAANGRSDVVCMLIAKGADPEAPFRSERTEYKRSEDGYRMLPTHKTTEDTKFGMHHPASSGHVAVIRILLDAGANMDTRDSRGDTAEEYAGRLSRGVQPKVAEVFAQYRKYPAFDPAMLEQMGKADFLEPNEHGYRLLDSPSVWRHIDRIDSHLQAGNESFTLEELERPNKDGVSALQRGVECFATGRVLDMCLLREGKIALNRLVEADGKATGLLDAIIARHELPRLFEAEMWRYNGAQDFRRFAQALPEEQRGQMPNYHAVYNELLDAENQREREGYGRSMVDRYARRSDSPRGIF